MCGSERDGARVGWEGGVTELFRETRRGACGFRELRRGNTNANVLDNAAEIALVWDYPEFQLSSWSVVCNLSHHFGHS